MFISSLMNEANVHEIQEIREVPGDSSPAPTPAPSATTTPDWIRVKEALSRYSLGRGQLYRLIGSGAIRSASLCQPGQTRATRLICRASLASYIESRAKGGAA